MYIYMGLLYTKMNIRIFNILELLAILLLVEYVGCSRMIVVNEDSGGSRSKREVGDQTTLRPDITDFNIISKVNARFATVDISSHVTNQQSGSLDTTFIVQIPESAFIANFSMITNGKLFIAKVFEKVDAQKKYDEAKSTNKSAGQIRHAKFDVKRGMDIFMVDVNVASFTDATFYLTYQELLERRLGEYRQRIIIQPGQIVKNLTVTALYNEEQGFNKFAYQIPNSDVERTSSYSAATLTASVDTKTIFYKPTETDQSASSLGGLDGELIVTYDVSHKHDGGIIIVKDEYFVHYLTPSGLNPMDKTILFLIDVSGSMGGNKIKQTRHSMMVILDKLNTNDYFNILIFNEVVESWLEVPVLAKVDNIYRAKVFVEKYVKAGGSTNINDALIQGIRSMKSLSEHSSTTRTRVIVLLTDGEPTAGETNTKIIRKNVYRENDGFAAIFCLGFGFTLDFAFLKHLAWENDGFARRIYEELDAPTQLKEFYLEIKDPLLTNVVVTYGGDVDLQSTTKKTFFQYFDGSEIIVVGKTKVPNSLSVLDLTVVAMSKRGTVNLPVNTNSVTVWNKDNSDFTGKLWAYKKIKELLEIADANDDATSKRMALNISLEYNFVTPLTSFVLVQDDYYQKQHNENDRSPSGRKRTNYNGITNSGFVLKPWLKLVVSITCILCFFFN